MIVARFDHRMITAMVEHARYESPREACGLMAVAGPGEVAFIYCLTNVDASAQTFTIDPEEVFSANAHAERHGWEVGGMFHSHPQGPPVPSATDRASGPPAGWIYALVSGEGVRVFSISGRQAHPLEIIIAGSASMEAPGRIKRPPIPGLGSPGCV